MQDTMRLAAQVGEQLVGGGGRHREALLFEGEPCFLKAGPVAGRDRNRWGAGARRPARVREYLHLSWMIERQFRAVLPLAGGVFYSWRGPRYEFLITREVRGAQTLGEVLVGPEPVLARECASELARELSRLHAVGFNYGQLRLGKLLVSEPVHGRRLTLTGPCHGTLGSSGRRQGRDLEQLLNSWPAAAHVTPASWLEEYEQGRSVQGRPLTRRWRDQLGARSRA